ncbi:MAG: hypothetical protein H6839_13665 [Planctomycetes bacterium]|nr:hypothetical protein [Planctomycetota bacterium]
MRFNALIIATSLLAIGGLVAYAPVRESLGLALDDSWQLALIHAELALAPLLFRPALGDRRKAFENLASAAACWGAGGAVVLLFSFASMHDLAWQTRPLSAGVWLAVSGILSLGARFGPGWAARGRVLLLCAFGLPALWHYLMLEYGEASADSLTSVSPSWALATNDVSYWPLLLAGVVTWAAALALPSRRSA